MSSVVRGTGRAMPGFRPLSRQTLPAPKASDTGQKNALNDVPIAELIRRNFGVKRTKQTSETNDETGANDEIIDDANPELAGQSADFLNPFQGFDEAELRAEGMEITNQYQKAEFNEPAPKRFGSRVRKSTPKWKESETDLFYRILSMCGTDFSMISKFFPNRTRRMIMNKFHCEEMHSPNRVAEALTHPKPLDLGLYAATVGIDEGSIIEDYKKNLDKLSDRSAVQQVRRPIPVVRQEEPIEKPQETPKEQDGAGDEIEGDLDF